MSSEAKRAFLWKADVLVRVPGSRFYRESPARWLAEIDLNFHDLRHDAGSPKLEPGWPLHAVLGVVPNDSDVSEPDGAIPHEFNERVPLTIVRARG